MPIIKNIKARFAAEDVYNIYSACMYCPTFDKFIRKSEEYMSEGQMHMFGYFDDEQLKGVIAVRLNSDDTAEIVGIGVDSQSRKKGIGKSLIDYAVQTLHIKAMTAETDDEAAMFYSRCGFEVNEYCKAFDTNIVKRYKCVLKNDKGNGK